MLWFNIFWFIFNVIWRTIEFKLESFYCLTERLWRTHLSLDTKIKILFYFNANPKNSCSEKTIQFKIVKFVARIRNKHGFVKRNCKMNRTLKFCAINQIIYKWRRKCFTTNFFMWRQFLVDEALKISIEWLIR